MGRRVTRLLVALAVGAGVVAVQAAAEEKAAAGRQEEKQFEKDIVVKAKLKYLLYLPEGYGKDDKAWPLVLFLHGAGESGNDLKKVKVHGPPKLIEAGKSFPAIVVSPQSPGRGWDPEVLNGLLDDLASKYKVDKDRIYLTGLSMGGYGSWTLAAAHPEKFAAVMPICGGGNPADAKKIKDLPIWVFHGAKDSVVRPQQSEAMIQALKDAGSEKVKYTSYPDAGHDSWTATYNNPEVWEWLFKQKRGG
jgi:predicted peptidase